MTEREQPTAKLDAIHLVHIFTDPLLFACPDREVDVFKVVLFPIGKERTYAKAGAFLSSLV